MKKNKVERRITVSKKEAEIIDAWAAAKGFKTWSALLLGLIEPAMNRSKVRDLHEQLIECRISRVEEIYEKEESSASTV